MSLEFYALLAVVDLVGLFITIWVSIVSVFIGWVLIVLVAIPLVEDDEDTTSLTF